MKTPFMSELKKFFSRSLFRLIALCMLPLILIPLLQYLTVSKHGSMLFLGLEIFIIYPFMGAIIALVILPFFLFHRGYRIFALRYLFASVVLVAAVFMSTSHRERIRMEAFHRLAERSQSLVQAIRSYEAQYGSPPPDMSALVPGFLPQIPHTGMGAYPDYEYRVGEKAAEFEGNPWVLVVFTSSGGINFDQFMYFPLQNYPDEGYGGRIERVLDWAYVHE